MHTKLQAAFLLWNNSFKSYTNIKELFKGHQYSPENPSLDAVYNMSGASLGSDAPSSPLREMGTQLYPTNMNFTDFLLLGVGETMPRMQPEPSSLFSVSTETLQK